MICNGLYLLSTTALDGVEGGGHGVLLLRDGTLRGGASFFYFLGTGAQRRIGVAKYLRNF